MDDFLLIVQKHNEYLPAKTEIKKIDGKQRARLTAAIEGFCAKDGVLPIQVFIFRDRWHEVRKNLVAFFRVVVE